MTADELLAMPEDGVDRWIIRGELRERPFAYHEWLHAATLTSVIRALSDWLDAQPTPRGHLYCGGAGVQLPGEPHTALGLDAAYLSAEVHARMPPDRNIIEAVPTLAVEILAPKDIQGDIDEKIDALMEAATPLVWIIDPRRRTVTVHRPDAGSALFNCSQELTAEPHLPGFRVPVVDLFE